MDKKKAKKKPEKEAEWKYGGIRQQNAEQTLKRKERLKKQVANHSGPASWTRRK